MVARNLLHKDKFEDFKSWLTTNGHEHRPGRGDYQILQIKWGSGWQVIYTKANAPEHLSVPHPLFQLVKRFIQESRLQAAVTAGRMMAAPLQPVAQDTPPWDQ